MPYRVEIEPLVPGATRRVGFDFSPFLAADETIVAATTFINVYSGVDPDPNLVIAEPLTIAGTLVYQFLAPSISGNTYTIQIAATTSEGQVVALVGYLVCLDVFDAPDDQQVVNGGTIGTVVTHYSSGSINFALSPIVVLTADQTRNGGRFQVNSYLAITQSFGVSPPEYVSANVEFYGVETGDSITTTLGSLNFNTLNNWFSQTKPVEVAPETQVRVYTFFSGIPVSGIYAYILSVDVIQLA